MQDENSIEVFIPRCPNPLIIDIEDYHIFSEKKKDWKYGTKDNRLLRSEKIPGFIHKRKTYHISRVIMNAPTEMIVDHINGNGMDNRKNNLRLATKAQNVQNSKKVWGCTSNYKGVYYHRTSRKYIANIRDKITGKMKHLGSFSSEVVAAKMYDKYAALQYGEFAFLNFPEERNQNRG